jgi:anti-sigma B factor antagonist
MPKGVEEVFQRRAYTSDLPQLAEMRAFLRSACRAVWDRHEDEVALEELELALSEAAANIMLHAYKGEKGRPIEMEVEADAEKVYVSLYHTGVDFDPAAVKAPAFDGTRESGFGLYLMGQLVDEVRYLRTADGRRGARLVKNRKPTGDSSMQPGVEIIDGVAVVTVSLEQLDASNADDFRRELGPVLQEHRQVVLDLGRVQFVDSRGCGAIISCLKQLSGVGGDLKLCGASRNVRQVFELIRLHKICEILPSRDEAVRAFHSGRSA